MKKILYIVLAIIFVFPIFCPQSKTSAYAEVSHADLSSVDRSSSFIIRVADFPPQYFMKNGEWTGVDVELARAVIKETGLKAVFVAIPWSRSLNDIKEGVIDLMLSITPTPERAEFMHFVGPQRAEKMGLIVHRKNKNLKIVSLKDLVNESKKLNVKIGIQQDIVYSKELDDKLKSDKDFAGNFYVLSNVNTFPGMTANGRLLGYFEDILTIGYQIKTNPEMKDLAIQGYLVSNEPVFFALSKKIDDKKLQMFRKACSKLEKNGTLKKIRNEWRAGGI